MSKKIKKIVDQFIQENGNSRITQKEMLMYVVNRVDKIDDKISDGAGKIAANRTDISGLKKVIYTFIGISASTFIFIMGWLIKLGGIIE